MTDRKAYLREYQRKWKAANREHVLAMERARYHAQSPEQKSEKVIKNRGYRRQVRLDAIDRYGGKCACCDESNMEFLCFDHINNDGATHRKQMADRSIAPWLRRNNYPNGFRVLCHNCNMARGIYGYCPHNNERSDDNEIL